MAITFVGFSGAAGTGAVTPALPSGLADGDIYILTIEGEGEDTNADAAPTGGAWTAIDGSTGSVASATDGLADRTRNSCYWAVYTAASPPNRVVPDAGNHTIAVITAWRGVDTTTPIHQVASSSSSTNNTSVSITAASNTSVDGCMIVVTTTAGDNNATAYPGTAMFSSWTNANLASITEAVDVNSNAGSDGAIGIAYGILTTAGAIGTTTATNSLSEEEANWCIALLPDSNVIEEPDAGSLSITGYAPSAVVSNVVAPTTASLDFSGKIPLAPVAGGDLTVLPLTVPMQFVYVIGLTLEGQPLTIDVSGGNSTADPLLGTLALAGQAPTVVISNITLPTTVSLDFAGQVPLTPVGNTAAPGTVALTLSGQTPSAPQGHVVAPTTVALTFTGNTPTLGGSLTSDPTTIGLSFGGQAPTASVANVVAPTTGSLTFTGNVPFSSDGANREPGTIGLAFSGQAPSVAIANNVSPALGTVAFSGKVPVADIVSPGLVEVPTGALNFWQYVGLKLEGYPPTVVVAAGNQTSDPTTGSLTFTGNVPVTAADNVVLPGTVSLGLSGQTPAAPVGNVTAPATIGLSFTGYTPTIGASDNPESPGTVALSLSGQTPTIALSHVSAPATASLDFNGKIPSVGDSTTREPATGSLTFTGNEPTLGSVLTSDPTTVALSFSGQTPTVQHNRVSDVPLGTLNFSGYAPDIPSAGGIEVPTGSLNLWQYIGLKLQGYPPTLLTDSVIPISTGALTFSGLVPTANVANVANPGLGTLAFSGKVPTIGTSDNPETPSTVSLAFASSAPLTVVSNVTAPTTASLVLGVQTPTLGAKNITVPSGSLLFSGYAPSTSAVLPATASMAFTGYAVTLSVTLSVPTGTITFTGYSGETISSEVPRANLTLTGYAPSTLIEVWGTPIINTNASTDIISNVNECDLSGFKQLPGSMKLTWNKYAVRQKSWDQRHPQETIRTTSPAPRRTLRNPEPDDVFIDTNVNPEDL